jgi:hypothetical protein
MSLYFLTLFKTTLHVLPIIGGSYIAWSAVVYGKRIPNRTTIFSFAINYTADRTEEDLLMMGKERPIHVQLF